MQEQTMIHPLLLKRADMFKSELKQIGDKMSSSAAFSISESKKLTRITQIVELYDQFVKQSDNISGLKEILSEPDLDETLKEEAELELNMTHEQLVHTSKMLKAKLLPPVLHADRPCLMELRPGAGGHEANIFTNDLLEMYIRFCQINHWPFEILSKSEHISGKGIVEATLMINEQGSYDRMRHEAGVHRVQRIPETENKGRVHTSAAAVIVLPKIEVDKSDPEYKKFKNDELRIDVMRASGSGGQHVNTTESAVRITHLPTGISVHIQDERSQLRNKEKALQILRARLADLEMRHRMAKEREQRNEQVSSVDRSDKIRTYNFPQSRVTDHRCNFTLYDLEGCLSGERLGEVIDNVAGKETNDRIAELISTVEASALH
ncbi:hypothetical protein KL920_003736 [Ogataea angusta]|nr:uncharacterized protein KL928_004160 [Ogataea angusta]KAG7816696.1 hypothetical protein KL928_004160 [Ogataea angusta]KAG7828599.1 hypothetical protein KL920_003736 [Ogataea angusta]KAG7838233.1 hypothetical protein KL943_000309 [Ogataea angusta]